MTIQQAERILATHLFKRVAHHVWWHADADPYIAVVHPSFNGECEVGLIHVFGPADHRPAFGSGTLATEWALERQLTDCGL